MGVREGINKNSAVTVGAIVVVLVCSVVVIGLELKGNSGAPPSKCYYSTDDGKTWFTDDSKKLPPFDYNGSPAVRCYVFSGPSGKFVGLLEKYSDQTLANIKKNGGVVPYGTPVMIKKPGDKEWRAGSGNDEAMVLLAIVGRADSGIQRVMP